MSAKPRRALARRAKAWSLCACLLLLACPGALAQKAGRLPSAEKIVGDYVKAAGGKKRLAAIRDALYEWDVENDTAGKARGRVLMKAPASVRAELGSGEGEIVSATSARTAWRRAGGGAVETLTGGAAQTRKLMATLAASRLVDYKKSKALARVAGVEQTGDEQAYVVEFSTREGGRARYWFGAASKLLLKTADAESGETCLYGDYRPVNGVLEAHRVTCEAGGQRVETRALRSVSHNAGIADGVFDPPGDAALDIPTLLREVARNQEELDARVGEYTFTRTQIEREINERGEVRKEKTLVHEVYPAPGGGRALKLISENGAPLAPDRAAKEERRVGEELEKLERENEKRKEKQERERAARARKRQETGAGGDGDSELGIAAFLRACEFVSPRRERFREREAVVFDFRPRANFKPRNDEESIISKLSGVVWIDPADKQVMRLEARLEKDFKIGGGLVASVRPGSAFAFEQARMTDGVWLPKFAQISASAKIFLFKGFSLDATREYSDYKRFSTKTGDDKLDAPEAKP